MINVLRLERKKNIYIYKKIIYIVFKNKKGRTKYLPDAFLLLLKVKNV